MAVDFTVIMAVRQRFGDRKLDETPSLSQRESGLEGDAPFVGLEKEFAFRCPSVDRGQFALLLFQSQGVSKVQALEINGQTIFGGIPVSVDADTRTLGSGSEEHDVRSLIARWNGNVMLIHPGVLQENNLLRIRAAEMTAGNLDDFIVDNVVVVFKTARQGPVADPGSVVTARKGVKKKAKAPAKKRRRR